MTWSILALALLGACGAALVLAGLGAIRLPTLPRLAGGISLDQEMARQLGEPVADRAGLPLLDRFLAPLVDTLMSRAPQDEQAWIDNALDLLDGKPYRNASDYYANRVAYAVAGFVGGVVLGFALSAAGGTPLFLLALPAGLGLLGYTTPKRSVHSALQRRREQMLFEVPYLLDRLAVNVLSERSLSQGLVAMVSAPDGSRDSTVESGYLMRELHQVAEDYLKSAGLADAFGRMAERNRDVPLVERFAQRVRMSEETGASITQALSIIGDRARAMVENTVRQRGEENSQLMIVPTMLSLLGIFIVIAAPTLTVLSQVF